MQIYDPSFFLPGSSRIPPGERTKSPGNLFSEPKSAQETSKAIFLRPSIFDRF